MSNPADPADPVAEEQAWDEAVTAANRRPRWSLQADWGLDGTFSHELSELTDLAGPITVERSRERTLPSVGTPEGAGSSSLNTTIAGSWDPTDLDSTTVAGAFAPWQPDAELFGHPLVHTPLRLDTGFGGRSERLFTGRLTRVAADSATAGVALSAIDGSTVMRAPITQQATGMDGTVLARFGPDRYNSRINSHWLFDRIFRANGFYQSPPPQPGAFISATCHGSTIPEIGGGGVQRQANLATPSAPSAWVGGHGAPGDHPHGAMYANPEGLRQSGIWTSPEQLTMLPGDGYGCSGLFRMPADPVSPYLFGTVINGGPLGPNGNYGGAYAVLITLEAGAPAMYVYTPADGLLGAALPWTRPSRPTWHHLGFHWSFRTSNAPQPNPSKNIPVDVALTIAIDGDSYAPQLYTLNTGDVRRNPWAPSTTIEYNMGGGVRFTNISWFRAPLAPGDGEWVGPGHVSGADIAPGMNELTGIPQLSGEDSWPLAKELAAAEAATIGLDRRMRPYVRTRAVMAAPGAPRELTATRSLGKVAHVTDEAAVRNSISAAVTPLLVDDYQWVLEAKDNAQFESGPGTTFFKVPLPPDTVLVEPWTIYQFKARVGWEALHDHPVIRDSWLFQAVYAHKPTLVVAPGLIDLGLFPGAPGEIIIAVYNFTGRTIRFATEDVVNPDTGEVDPGSAAFKLPGRLLKAQATVPQNIQDPGSVAVFGARTHDLGGGSNRWHQHGRAVQGVAEGMLAQTAHPCPAFGTVQVLHDPRLDLDDAVRVVNPAGIGVVRGIVDKSTTTLDPNAAATDDLTLQALAPPGFGVLEDDELGGVGTTLRFGA